MSNGSWEPTCPHCGNPSDAPLNHDPRPPVCFLSDDYERCIRSYAAPEWMINMTERARRTEVVEFRVIENPKQLGDGDD